MFDSAIRSASAAPDSVRSGRRGAGGADPGLGAAGVVGGGRAVGAIAELARRRPRDLLDRRPGGQSATRGHPGRAGGQRVRGRRGGGRAAVVPAGGRRPAALRRRADQAAGTAAALRDGVLDVPKVRAVVDAVTPLEDPTALRRRAAGCCRGPTRQTVGQLRSSLARAVLAADPAAAEQRHEQAVAGRRGDGAAAAGRDGRAVGAAAGRRGDGRLLARIDRIARAAPARDPRGMDARRADALVTTVLTAGLAAAGAPGPDSAAAPATPAAAAAPVTP